MQEKTSRENSKEQKFSEYISRDIRIHPGSYLGGYNEKWCMD